MDSSTAVDPHKKAVSKTLAATAARGAAAASDLDEHRLNISPHVYVACAVTVSLGSFFAFSRYGGTAEWFFVPVFIVAAAWGLINANRQRIGYSVFSTDKGRGATYLFWKALPRYVVWLVIIYSALQFFQLHPFYRGYEKVAVFLNGLFDAYLVVGIPYFMLTLRYKASRVEDFYDPAVRLLHMGRHLFMRTVRRDPAAKVLRPLRNRYNRKVLLNLLMRAYFLPVMFGQIAFNLEAAIRYSGNGFNNYDFLTVLFWLSSMLWFTEALVASTAYGLESRWMENRSRSIDLTLSGWLICLCCYAPMNEVTGTLFPFGPSIANTAAETLLVTAPAWIYALKSLEVILLAMLVYSDLSLGPSSVNITFKRLQTRGPYAIVRHPATTCKMLLWWLQAGIYGAFWSLPLVLGHLGWNAIYVLRALTEERHLRHFPEYRTYMEKVKYRFIPGVI